MERRVVKILSASLGVVAIHANAYSDNFADLVTVATPSARLATPSTVIPKIVERQRLSIENNNSLEDNRVSDRVLLRRVWFVHGDVTFNDFVNAKSTLGGRKEITPQRRSVSTVPTRTPFRPGQIKHSRLRGYTTDLYPRDLKIREIHRRSKITFSGRTDSRPTVRIYDNTHLRLQSLTTMKLDHKLYFNRKSTTKTHVIGNFYVSVNFTGTSSPFRSVGVELKLLTW